jgi:hypothetical protein
LIRNTPLVQLNFVTALAAMEIAAKLDVFMEGHSDCNIQPPFPKILVTPVSMKMLDI